MIEQAVCKVGLTLSEFLNMTLFEYRMRIEYFVFNRDTIRANTRELCYTVYCALTPKNERVSINEYMPLSIDVAPEQPKETDPAEIERIKELAYKRMQALGK